MIKQICWFNGAYNITRKKTLSGLWLLLFTQSSIHKKCIAWRYHAWISKCFTAKWMHFSLSISIYSTFIHFLTLFSSPSIQDVANVIPSMKASLIHTSWINAALFPWRHLVLKPPGLYIVILHSGLSSPTFWCSNHLTAYLALHSPHLECRFHL